MKRALGDVEVVASFVVCKVIAQIRRVPATVMKQAFYGWCAHRFRPLRHVRETGHRRNQDYG